MEMPVWGLCLNVGIWDRRRDLTRRRVEHKKLTKSERIQEKITIELGVMGGCGSQEMKF